MSWRLERVTYINHECNTMRVTGMRGELLGSASFAIGEWVWIGPDPDGNIRVERPVYVRDSHARR